MQKINNVAVSEYAVDHITDTARKHKHNSPEKQLVFLAVFFIKNYANRHYNNGYWN